jgi:four helix bundle protein
MARGSLMETLEHLITAYDEKYIAKEDLMSFKTHIDTCGKLINGYINYLNKAKRE